MHKIDAFTVFAPERSSDPAFRKRRERDRLAAAVGVRDVEIFYVCAVPDECDMLAVRRPNGVRRMLDVDELLNRERRFSRRFAARSLRAQMARANQRRCNGNGRTQNTLPHAPSDAHSASS